MNSAGRYAALPRRYAALDTLRVTTEFTASPFPELINPQNPEIELPRSQPSAIEQLVADVPVVDDFVQLPASW